jgi:hypothetical protein
MRGQLQGCKRGHDDDVIKLPLIAALQHAMDDGDGGYRAPTPAQPETPRRRDAAP